MLLDQRGVAIACRTCSLESPSSGALLQAIGTLLRSRRIPITALRGIDVTPGPGKFSRVRLGVVTANALAWALGVPLSVRGKRVRIARPEYGAEPHIR